MTTLLFPNDDTSIDDGLWLFWMFNHTKRGLEMGVVQSYGTSEQKFSPFYARVRSYFGGGLYPETHLALFELHKQIEVAAPWGEESPLMQNVDGDMLIRNAFDVTCGDNENPFKPFRLTCPEMTQHPKIKHAVGEVLLAMHQDSRKALFAWSRFPHDFPLRCEAQTAIKMFQTRELTPIK